MISTLIAFVSFSVVINLACWSWYRHGYSRGLKKGRWETKRDFDKALNTVRLRTEHSEKGYGVEK